MLGASRLELQRWRKTALCVLKAESPGSLRRRRAPERRRLRGGRVAIFLGLRSSRLSESQSLRSRRAAILPIPRSLRPPKSRNQPRGRTLKPTNRPHHRIIQPNRLIPLRLGLGLGLLLSLYRCIVLKCITTALDGTQCKFHQSGLRLVGFSGEGFLGDD